MTQSSSESDIADLLHSISVHCINMSKYIFHVLDISSSTDAPNWDRIREMALVLCEGYADRALLWHLMPDEKQRRLLARGIALSAVEDAAQSVGLRWP
jgi:hypothetical protein